jgi:4-hydroxy-tetrahydrodipicolinate synthase
LVTPFNDAEELDLGALGRIVEKTIAAGVHGLFAVGSQGEFWALSATEQRAVIDATVKAAAGRVPVYAGVSAITTRAVLELARAAEDAGADALTVLPPFFIAPSEAELERHFTTIADAVGVPIVLYNQPGRTSVSLGTALVTRLAEHPRIAAVKDSSGNINQTTASGTRAPGQALLPPRRVRVRHVPRDRQGGARAARRARRPVPRPRGPPHRRCPSGPARGPRIGRLPQRVSASRNSCW